MKTTVQPRINKRLGWVPDLPDPRDLTYSLPSAVMSAALPSKVDLREGGELPPIRDQGDLGACTAFALAAAFQFSLDKQKLREFTPSPLFLYYNERAMMGTIKEDSGAMIRDGVKSLSKQGICLESSWKYIPTKFAKKPPVSVYTKASKNLVSKYERITPALPFLKGRLASGFPFVFGFSVFESFFSSAVSSTGNANLPNINQERFLGGHAVLCVGYDDANNRFIIQNSWGPLWGDKGFFTLPYEYLTDPNMADDFWAITFVTKTGNTI